MCESAELDSSAADRVLAEAMRLALAPCLGEVEVRIGWCKRFDERELFVRSGDFVYDVLGDLACVEDIKRAFRRSR